jgi:hypothetical protein
MTHDTSFRSKLHSGYWMKKWLFFGEKEWIRPRYELSVGTGSRVLTRDLTPEDNGELCAGAQKLPVAVFADGRKRWWLYKERCFHHRIEDDDPEVIKGLIIQKDASDQARRDKAVKVARSNSD